MKIKFYIVLLFILGLIQVQSQNNCNNPIQLCFSNNSSISFPAATSGTAQIGPDYGCLASQSAPTWFYIKTVATITNSVTQFVISSSTNIDVDGIVWGPSVSNTAFCSVISNSAAIIDCSYSAANTETLTISNTLPNQYYILMVTNYSGMTTNIEIACIQGGNNIFCPPGAPNADFSMPNSSICQGQSVTLTDLSAPSGSITSWDYNCAAATPTSSTFQNPSFTFSTPGTHTISLTVAASGGLTSTISKTIQVNPLPNVIVSPANQTICAGKTATLNLSGAANYMTNPGAITLTTFTVSPSSTTIYTITGTTPFGCSGIRKDTVKVVTPPTIFSSVSSNTVCFGNGITFTNSGGASYTLSPTALTGNTINVTPSTLGTTIFTVTGSGPFGCINTKTVSITTYSLPVVLVTPSNTTICSGQTINLLASGAGSYTWTTGATSANIGVSPTAPTSYSVLGRNSIGCENSASALVNVISTPIVSVNSPSTNVCFGYTMTVIANGSSNYIWSTGATTNTITIQPFSNFTYSVVGTNGGMCSDTSFLPITVMPLPSVSASVSNTMACAGQTISLNATGNATTYYWQPNNLFGSTHVVQIFIPTTYTVYAQGSNGCAFLSTASVNVQNATAIIPVVTPSAICMGDSARLSVIGGNVPSWSSNPFPNRDVVTPITNTSYTLSAVDFNGCVSDVVFNVLIKSDCDVVVYNGFTPNGDGVNDFFVIDNIDKYPNNNVYIFNRWGNKIFFTSRYDNRNNNWDGKTNGKPVTSGTYFYMIVNDNDRLLKKGWIEITN